MEGKNQEETVEVLELVTDIDILGNAVWAILV